MKEKVLKLLPRTFKKSLKIVCVQGLGFVGAAMSLIASNARLKWTTVLQCNWYILSY